MGSTGSTLAISLSQREISKDQLDPALLKIISKNGQIAVPDILSFDTVWSLCACKVDVYLSHDRGINDVNHLHVAEINKKLKDKHLLTRFQEKIVSDDKIADGIDNASCMVVFITKEYLEKIEGDDSDVCKIEFLEALQSKSADKMIPVVLDSTVRDFSKWPGVIGKALSHLSYIDMSEAITDTKINDLYHRIVLVVGDVLQNLYERCMAFIIGSHIGIVSNATNDDFPLLPEGPVVVSKTEWHPVRSFGGETLAVCFYSDNSKVIACKTDIKVWSVEGKLLSTHDNGSKIHCACLNKDNSLLITGDDRQTIKIWNTATWKVKRFIDGLFGPVICAQFSPDGSQIVSVSSNYSVDVWSVKDGTNVTNCSFDVRFPEAVVGAVYSPDGSKIAVLIHNSSVKIVDAATGNLLCGIPVKLKGDKSVGFTSAGHLVAADGKTISVRDINNGNILLTYQIPQIGGFDIFLCSIGSKVAFSFGSEIMIWDSQSGELNQTIKVSHNVNGALYFSADGSYLAWTSVNGKLNILN